MEEKRTVEMGEERTRHHFEEDDDEDSKSMFPCTQVTITNLSQ